MLTRDPSRSSTRQSTQSSSAPDTSNVAKNFGRDTPLGRQMFALYNKKVDYAIKPPSNQGSKGVDPYVDHVTKKAIDSQSIKQRIHGYHNPIKRTIKQPTTHAIDQIVGSRKKAIDIQEETKTFQSDYEPVPLDQLIDDGLKKQRLQSLMSGIDESISQSTNQTKQRRMNQRRDDSYSVEDLRNSIYRELQEREDFLDQLEQLAQQSNTASINQSVKQHRTTITAEIAELMRDLKALG